MFYTVAAAAKATGLSKSTVLAAIEAGQVTGTKDLFGEWEIEHSDLHRLYAIVGEPSVGIDGAQQYTARDAANLEAEIEVLIRDAGDSLRQSFDEGQYEPHARYYQSQASQRMFTGPTHAPWSATSPQGQEAIGSASPLPTVLIAGALLVALGLGWIGGSNSYLFLGLPASTSLKQDLNSPSRILGSEDESIGITPAENSRDAKPGAQYPRKLATTTATRPGRAHDSPQGPAQPITAFTNPISSVAQQKSTSSPQFAGVAVQQPGKISSRPIAVPETRPTTIEGWTVRDVVGGKAVLEGPNGIWKVTRGDAVPGVGTVDSIVRWGNRWIVATSSGLITTQ
jgi:hypothetical protein